MPNSQKLERRSKLPLLTKRQLETLRVFRAYVQKHGVAPSLADLAGELSVSAPTVSLLLSRIETAGCIKSTPARYRGYRITKRGAAIAAQERAA